jgi:protein-S-isoprenylcysteine O-methyltransferase Ste14
VDPFTLFFLLYFAAVVFIKVKVFRIRGDEGGTLQDDWTFPAIFVSYLIAVMASLVEYFIATPRIVLTVSALGYLMGTAGVILTRSSVMTLGRWWSVRIEVKKGHQVIEAGPYRISRHPYYLGTLLELAGLSLILNSFRAFLYVVLVHVPLLLARISSEEEVLCRVLGSPYLEYRKRTRLIPIPFLQSLADTQDRSSD